MKFLKICLAIFMGFVFQATAQDASDIHFPNKAPVYYLGFDAPGGDFESLFDVSYDRCVNLCLANNNCQKITYNIDHSACFLKTGQGNFEEYEGASSAVFEPTSQQVLSLANQRLDELAFLPESNLQAALDLRELLAVSVAGASSSGGYLDEIQLISRALRGHDSTAFMDLSGQMSRIKEMHKIFSSTNYPSKDTSSSVEQPVYYSINAYLVAPAEDEALYLNRIAKNIEDASNGRADNFASLRVYELAAQKNPQFQAAYEDAIERLAPSSGKLSIDVASETPKICIDWETELDAAVEYVDYIDANFPATAIASGNALCIEGADFGYEGNLKIRAGVPLGSGMKTLKAESYDVIVPDREPFIRFDSSNYIIPAGRKVDLPLISVNYDEVPVELFRLSERNLIKLIENDQFLQNLDSYDLRYWKERGATSIFKSTLEVENKTNKEVATGIPFADIIENEGAGLYLATASGANEEIVTQWFLISDIALTSFSGKDGLHVFARTLSKTNAIKNATVSIVSKSNEVIAETKTDGEGYAHFSAPRMNGSNENQPAFAVVKTDDDFNFLTLTRAAFDFSDRGVFGREAPGDVDVFIATDRGIYLPGDEVHATLIARDAEANAIDDVKLTTVISRPDGKEYLRRFATADKAGGAIIDFELSAYAKTGYWKIETYIDPDAPPIARSTFIVDYFVPQKIEYDLNVTAEYVDPTVPLRFELDARYLYGAVGSNMAFNGRLVREAITEIPQFPDVSFETSQYEKSSDVELIDRNYTDASGKYVGTQAVPFSESAHPLQQVELIVEMSEGSGRPVQRSKNLLVNLEKPLIGIKPLFEEAVRYGDDAGFQLLAIGPNFKQVDLVGAKWELVRVYNNYHWYKYQGDWKYRVSETYENIGSGNIDINQVGTNLTQRVDWGEYELRVHPDGDKNFTRQRFYAGYYGGGDKKSDAPDRLLTALDKDKYDPNDRLILNVESIDEATAIITIFNSKLVEERSVNLRKGDNEIKFDLNEKWGSGAYIITSAIRPMDEKEGRLPSRSVGVNWVQMANDDKTLDVAITSTQKVASRGINNFELTFNEHKGERVFVTVSAVDKGILNITDFKPPAPDEYFFSQRRLGFDMRDHYGDLINVFQGETGAFLVGGSDDGEQSAPPITSKQDDYLALFEGIIEVGRDGKASIPLDIPQFNGTMRVMATAWSEKSLGHAFEDFEIRDPVVVSVHHPLFLGIKDETQITVELAHIEGATGEGTLNVTSNAVFGLNETHSVNIGAEQHTLVTLPLKAMAEGEGVIDLTLTTPDGVELKQTRRISVVNNLPLIETTELVPVGGGQTTILNVQSFPDFTPDSNVTIAPLFMSYIDQTRLARRLDEYPYRCSEQITSRSIAPLYFPDFPYKDTTAATIMKETGDLLKSRQLSNGSFGLYSNDYPASDWLQAYILDMLSEAQDAYQMLDEHSYTQAINSLRNLPQKYTYENADTAAPSYALYVLAKLGKAKAGDIRYFYKARLQEFDAPLSVAFLASAMKLYNEPQDAQRVFEKAIEMLRTEHYKYQYRSYRTHSRDLFGVAYLGVKYNFISAEDAIELVTSLDGATSKLNTQETAWAMRLSDELKGSLNANTVLHMSFDQFMNANQGKVVNPLNRNTVMSVSVDGRVNGEIEPEQNGFAITREYFDREGNPVSAWELKLNEQYIVVLNVDIRHSETGDFVVEDQLPAGLEIDSDYVLKSNSKGGLPWMNDMNEPQYAEFLPNAFRAYATASGNGDGEAQRFAYSVRAISKGRFMHPPAKVEDMYVTSETGYTAGGYMIVIK